MHCSPIQDEIRGCRITKICESTPIRGEEAAEEEADHLGEMGELRPLWCMTQDHL
jgi:hypothetical protein